MNTPLCAAKYKATLPYCGDKIIVCEDFVHKWKYVKVFFVNRYHTGKKKVCLANAVLSMPVIGE